MSRPGSLFLVALVAWISVAPALARADIGAPGDVLVSLYGNIVRIDPKTNERTVIAPGTGALAFDLNGDLIAVSYSRIERIDFETGELTTIRDGSLGGGTVGGSAVAPDGGIYVATSSGKLFEVDPLSGDATVRMSGISCQVDCYSTGLTGVAFTASGDVVVVLKGSSSSDPGYVLRLDLEAGTSEILGAGGLLNEAFDLVETADGGLLVANRGRIVEVDPATGEQSVVSEGGKILSPYQIALSDVGKVYFTELGSAGRIVGGSQVVEVDPLSGLQRILARPVFVEGIAVVPGIPAPPACADGLDNDGDGRRDFPRDLGCSSPGDGTEEPPCADGIDNDQDGLIDFADDPGCGSADPIEQEAPQCSDLLDNDGDGLYDHPEDPECLSPSDNTEHWIPPQARYYFPPAHEPGPHCGLQGVELLLPAIVLRARRRRRRA